MDILNTSKEEGTLHNRKHKKRWFYGSSDGLPRLFVDKLLIKLTHLLRVSLSARVWETVETMLVVSFIVFAMLAINGNIPSTVHCREQKIDYNNKNQKSLEETTLSDIKSAECQCIGQRYFCPASTSNRDQCIDYSIDDVDTGLPRCQYVWQYTREVVNLGVELSSCFETQSCSDVNDTAVCICKSSQDPHKVKSVTPKAMTTCHFFHHDRPYQFLNCICKSFHSEQRQARENTENSQKIVLVLLVLLFISMMSLACIITCYTYSARPPRIPYGDDDE